MFTRDEVSHFSLLTSHFPSVAECKCAFNAGVNSRTAPAEETSVDKPTVEGQSGLEPDEVVGSRYLRHCELAEMRRGELYVEQEVAA